MARAPDPNDGWHLSEDAGRYGCLLLLGFGAAAVLVGTVIAVLIWRVFRG